MTNPWPWYALGLALLAVLLYLANEYMAREYQQTRDRLLVGSDLDTLEPEDPFAELDEAWLAEIQIGGWRQ